MKILFGITKSNFGGAQRYVFDLAKEAKNRGFDVAVLLGGEGALKQKLEEIGVRVIPLLNLERDIKILQEFKSFWQIIKTLKREKPDVFHINSSKMGGLGALAGRLTGIKKIIFTAHGWAFNERSRHWLSLLMIEEISWLTIFLSHKTICVSDSDFRDVINKPLVKDKLVVIKNGIMPFPLLSRETAREEISIDKEKFIVGTIAELHKNKGLDTALRAVNQVRDVELVILGEGEERGNLRLLANTLGISERVNMPGFKSEARKYLNAFDIFILPSRKEGMPYSILEAGLASLPVIATKIGGLPEIVTDGKTGLLVGKEDYRGLAKAIQELKENSSLRKKLGENLKKLVSTDFSEARMLEKTFALYLKSD